MERSVVRWSALNYALDVWLTNSDKNLLGEDVLVATVPAATYELVTKVPDG